MDAVIDKLFFELAVAIKQSCDWGRRYRYDVSQLVDTDQNTSFLGYGA